MRSFYEVGQLVQLLPCVFGSPFGTNTYHGLGLLKYRKAHPGGEVLLAVFEFYERHIEARIRFVGAIEAHSFGVGHTRHGGNVNSFYFFEEVPYQAFKSLENIFLLHEGHLAVYLCKLRLAVGAEVFVAKAFYNLVVAVEACYHEQLFEGLGRLRQGIKLPRIHTRRHYEVARTFGCGLDEHGRFYFNKKLAIEVVACGLCHTVAQNHIVAHDIAAKV